MMDLVHLLTFEPANAERVLSALRARVDDAWFAPWARLRVEVAGPWRPADTWVGGLERPVWTVTVSGDEGLTTEGLAALAELNTMARRHAPATLAEAVAPDLGAALVVVHSDPGRSAYVGLYREGRVRFSLRLDDGRVVARCDGQRVVVESPPRHLPEGDRAGVVIEGLRRFFTEMPVLEGADRLCLVDVLAELATAPASVAEHRVDLGLEALRPAASQ